MIGTKRALKTSIMIAALAAGTPIMAQDEGLPKYVSMGSSYAAGPGVGTRIVASGACDRSTSNYAQLLAKARHLRLVDVSCSGATTANILTTSQNGFAPQIEALDMQTKLVTVTIGGNDVDYIGNLLGYTCRDTGGKCGVVSDAEVEKHFQALPGALRAVIAQVHSRAPNAKLVMIGYLPVIPDTGPGNCAAVPLSTADAARMRAVAVRLAQVIGSVAAATGTPVVPASSIGSGHDACSSIPYTAGYYPPKNPTWLTPVQYHPVQLGMARLALAIDLLLSGVSQKIAFQP